MNTTNSFLDWLLALLTLLNVIMLMVALERFHFCRHLLLMQIGMSF
ncbi:MAG: hypothetical protein LBB76_08270 [Azoarcus sp.]|nr:hypothetical protein [Azoarcus sp.]